MKIRLKNQVGMIKECPAPGFSIGCFLLGWIWCLIKGNPKQAAINLGVSLVTFSLGGIYWWFAFNKLNIQDLLEKGYEPADEMSSMALISKGLIAVPQNN